MSDACPTTPGLTQAQVQPLLKLLHSWQKTTTVILHGGSVFEFKGQFPIGTEGRGYYNLKGTTGFEGHLNLQNLTRVSFQDTPRGGKSSYAFVFENDLGEVVFKVFVGRDENGEVIAEQAAVFQQIQQSLQLPD